MQNGKSLGAAFSGGSAGTTSEARLRLVLGAMGSFRVGDFTMRLPIDWADTEGQIAGV